MPKADAKFLVHIGGDRHKRFATLPDAIAFCSRVFDACGVVLSITRA